ncbi:MAG: DUF1836 domain-containing protein [Clostridia bacterium]|nr:DUF1836 domain-containing protein [Clostridia bacterium]
MDNEIRSKLSEVVRDFTLPRYNEIPNMGLYLEQTTKYIKQTLITLDCFEVTGSMIRNYVKMGLVKNPEKKLYYRDQIAHLISITILKAIIPLDVIQRFFKSQETVYTDQVAYDYFCMEMENILHARFGLTDDVKDIGTTNSIQKEMLRSAITAVSHLIYVNECLKRIDE